MTTADPSTNGHTREFAWRPGPARPMNLVGRDHPALRRPAEPLGIPEPKHQALAAQMVETLRRRAEGLALAAPQVGHSLQIVVTTHWAVAEPHVTPVEDDGMTVGIEGCLSLPGRWFSVPRWNTVEIKAYDLFEEGVVRLGATGLAARVWQHERDHLDGLLLADHYDEVRIGRPAT